jgi:predicted nucleic acid-binding protein
MIVVADTGPLRYLAMLRLTDVLPQLYFEIFIPPEVYGELLDPRSPDILRQSMINKPHWLTVRSTNLQQPRNLAHLDKGEIAAILLAAELNADSILVDDLDARRSAQEIYGIPSTGTLGVLRNAHHKNLLDGHAAFTRLVSETNFYHSPELDRTYLDSLKG